LGDGTSPKHGTCLMHARMKRKKNICNVMTQDMLGSFGNEGEK